MASKTKKKKLRRRWRSKKASHRR